MFYQKYTSFLPHCDWLFMSRDDDHPPLCPPCSIHFNTPLLNYASVPANSKLQSRLVLCCAIPLLYFLAQHSTSFDFRLLFAGTEV